MGFGGAGGPFQACSPLVPVGHKERWGQGFFYFQKNKNKK